MSPPSFHPTYIEREGLFAAAASVLRGKKPLQLGPLHDFMIGSYKFSLRRHVDIYFKAGHFRISIPAVLECDYSSIKTIQNIMILHGLLQPEGCQNATDGHETYGWWFRNW